MTRIALETVRTDLRTGEPYTCLQLLNTTKMSEAHREVAEIFDASANNVISYTVKTIQWSE